MAHSSEKRWADVAQQVSAACSQLAGTLSAGEELYQDLLELHAFAGGTTQLLADQLFAEEIAQDAGLTEADAAMVAKTQDAVDAMLAIHQMYQAATNTAVATADRLSEFRRFT